MLKNVTLLEKARKELYESNRSAPAFLAVSAVSVRAATPEDTAALARVHVASWQAAYKNLLPADLLARLNVERRTQGWRRNLEDSSQGIFVYENAGEIVAFTNFGPCRDEDKNPETVAELMTLYALPSVWGKGVGKALWHADLSALRERGYFEVTLWVLDGNERAARFYKAAGFTVDGVTKTEQWREDLSILEQRMTRKCNDR